MAKIQKTAKTVASKVPSFPSPKDCGLAGSFWTVAIGNRGVKLTPADKTSDGGFIPRVDVNGDSCHLPSVNGEQAKAYADGGKIPWSGKGESAALGKALGAWVSSGKSAWRLMSLESALASKVVRLVKIECSPEASEKLGVVDSRHPDSAELPKYIGTFNRYGRREPYSHPDPTRRESSHYANFTGGCRTIKLASI